MMEIELCFMLESIEKVFYIANSFIVRLINEMASNRFNNVISRIV